MNPCKLKDPKVINSVLLRQCILQQFPKGECQRLAEQEGVPYEEVDQIRLEFQNILRIDHLWMLSSLTKLALNNNLIEKMEQLDGLVNLVELDLSFNKISIIENLETLVNLERLSLFKNFITKLENMEPLKKLNFLSIGCNQIDDLENVIYLRQFKHLKSLNMAQNPCVNKDPDFRLFIAAYLPQVVYNEYRLIHDSERESGRSMHLSELRAIENEEEEKRVIEEREELERYNNELDKKAFIEYFNTTQLFDSLFTADEDGQALLQMGEEVDELYLEYQEQFVTMCKEMFTTGQSQYLIRNQEIAEFTKRLEDTKLKNQQISIREIEIFSRDCEQLQSQIDYKAAFDDYIKEINRITNTFDNRLHKLWKTLMKLELELVEQMEEILQNFEHGIIDLINQFIEASRTIFTQLRLLEMTFNENLTALAEQFLATSNLEDVDPKLREIMVDTEVLMDALANSNYSHVQVIDNREDLLISRAQEWCKDLVETLHKAEIARNRNKILEINHFLDTQKEKFDYFLQQVEEAYNNEHEDDSDFKS